MRITLFLSDGQVLKFEKNNTTPQLQRDYPIGGIIKGSKTSIEATTIE